MTILHTKLLQCNSKEEDVIILKTELDYIQRERKQLQLNTVTTQLYSLLVVGLSLLIAFCFMKFLIL